MAGLARRGAKSRGEGSTKREALTVCDNEGRGGQEIVELLLRGDVNRGSHCDGVRVYVGEKSWEKNDTVKCAASLL
jgi:hypothetical protein